MLWMGNICTFLPHTRHNPLMCYVPMIAMIDFKWKLGFISFVSTSIFTISFLSYLLCIECYCCWCCYLRWCFFFVFFICLCMCVFMFVLYCSMYIWSRSSMQTNSRWFSLLLPIPWAHLMLTSTSLIWTLCSGRFTIHIFFFSIYI